MSTTYLGRYVDSKVKAWIRDDIQVWHPINIDFVKIIWRASWNLSEISHDAPSVTIAGHYLKVSVNNGGLPSLSITIRWACGLVKRLKKPFSKNRRQHTDLCKRERRWLQIEKHKVSTFFLSVYSSKMLREQAKWACSRTFVWFSQENERLKC